jgi:hypothetical protein
MSVGEYVSVFVSIVLGLGVADLAVSLHKLLLAQKRVRWDWLSPAIAVFTALNIIAVWWATYDWYQRAPNLTMFAFLPDFILLVLLFLSAAASLPEDVPAEGLDLRAFYFDRSRYFWTLNLLQLLIVAAAIVPREAPAADWQALAVRQAENLPLIIAVAILVATKRPWVHRLLVGAMLGFLVYGFVGTAMHR